MTCTLLTFVTINMKKWGLDRNCQHDSKVMSVMNVFL